MLSHYTPPPSVVVQFKYPNELLEMVVEHGMVQPCVNVVQVRCNDGMSLDEVKIYTGRGFQRWWMNSNTSEIADDETLEFFRRPIESSNTVLWVTFESNSVVNDRRKECSEKNIREPGERISL